MQVSCRTLQSTLICSNLEIVLCLTFICFYLAEHVLSYVEESLLTVRLFKKRACTKLCGLSWSVLKCLAGISVGMSFAFWLNSLLVVMVVHTINS